MALDKEALRRQREIEHLRKVEFERDFYKQVAEKGEAIINWYSTDCDGVHGQGSVSFKTLDEYYTCIEDMAEWADGPFRLELSEEPVEKKTWGQGWGIN
jgi:hypothetical protein